MRLCIYAMAPMPQPLIQAIASKMAPHILLATGQTEIYPITMSFDPLVNPGRDANYWGLSGLACETAIMDDDGRLLPAGEVGEIVHRGPNVMLGYFKDPQATAAAQKFGWHHTGDLGMFDSGGQMLFLDRKKDMIKTGGENVASREVEETVYRLAGVSEVAVVGVPHPRWVEAVVAVVVVKEGHALEEAQVLAHCAAQMASFKAPKRVVFVDSLPKNPSGKLLKRQLRDRFAGLFSG
jgi:long-chain acyl-CoA synthetase